MTLRSPSSLFRPIEALSPRHRGLPEIYYWIRDMHIEERKHLFLQGPIWRESKEGKLSLRNYVNNKWEEKINFPHPRDQGAIIYGKDLRFIAAKTNIQAMLTIKDTIDPDLLLLMGWVSRHGEDLVFKRDAEETRKISRIPVTERDMIFGSETHRGILRYEEELSRINSYRLR